MAFFDKVSNIAKSAADKTGEMVEVSKINLKINECKGKVAAGKTQLGEYYWKKYESGEALDDQAMEICAQIKTENDTIEQYNNEIQKIKGAEVKGAEGGAAPKAGAFCTSCGADVSGGKSFCPGCGAKVN